MTLKEYLELSEEDKIQCQHLIEHHLSFDSLVEIPGLHKSIIDIETYYAERLREREQITTITWPGKLSKKETVICRLKMVLKMLQLAPVSNDVVDAAETMKKMCIVFVNSVIKETFQQKTTKEVKWPGLNPEAAALVNTIYIIALKFYERKLKV